MSLELTSCSFSNEKVIPARFTGIGDDCSPHVAWRDIPAGTKSIALILDDPDAPGMTFVHWIVFNIPPGMTELREGIPEAFLAERGIRSGMNDFGRTAYGGPYPPPGKPHRYFFKLYCLDRVLSVAHGARKKDLLDAMRGHVLAEAQMVGVFGR